VTRTRTPQDRRVLGRTPETASLARKTATQLAELALNTLTGLAALALLTLLAVTSVAALASGRAPRALRPAHRLAAFQLRRADRILPRTGTRPGETPLPGTLLWLAAHSVTGPAFPAVAWAMLAALDYVFFRLRPVETSHLNTFALSVSSVAIVVLILLSVPLFHTAQARLTRRLLDPRSRPDVRVRELAESRAAVLDAHESELRRIERDLHDGAQAKLIAIRMHLALARGCGDPGETLRMIDEAREAAADALTDLRDLVRGIHPPVLADRGLTGAVEASALLCPIPVELDVDLPGRPPPPVESAVYFAAAEALTNVTKHSAASRAWVRLGHADGVLRLTVGDDGHGGARPERGTGLRGVQNRLSAFDGTLTVSSPPGGPTELIMEVPCALSSPKISPC